MDKSKLLTFDEYNRTEHKSPYIFEHGNDTRKVFYFGSRHSYNPDDEQFTKLEEVWGRFLKETEGKKRIAFEEGGRRPFIADKKEAILKSGEMGYLVNLATNAQIDIFCPEPPQIFSFNELLKHFSKEKIAYHEFARVCYQWNNMTVKPDFEEYMQRFLEGDKKGSGWSDFEFSIPHMIKIQETLFGTKFDKDDKKFFYDIINPTTEKSVINKISRFEDESFRDGYILGQIEKYWNEGFSIFIVYGSGHAVRQEPAIKTLY